MKNAIEWFEEKGFAFDHKITVGDVIDLQNDARKDGLMTAQLIASAVINRESTKYAVPDQRLPASMTLNGLNYFVSSAIISEADRLDYLPGRRRKQQLQEDNKRKNEILELLTLNQSLRTEITQLKQQIEFPTPSNEDR